MQKKYLSRRYIKWSIATLVLIGLIGFTASHAFVNYIDEEENGEDRIIVKIIKIEDGDTTIIEKQFDDITEFNALKHHLKGDGGNKGGLLFRAKHSIADNDEDVDIKIKVIDYGSDSSSSIHKKIIICFNEDTLEHEDIHINLQDIHSEIAKIMEELDVQIAFDNNWIKNMHKLMEEFEMDIDIHSDGHDEKMEILIKSLHGHKEFKDNSRDVQYDSDAI